MENTENGSDIYEEPRRHFVLLSTARSGSTLLMDLLNNHPELRCILEPLNREILAEKHLTGASKEELLSYVKHGLDTTKEPVVGIKLFLEHFINTGLTIRDVLGIMTNPKVIVIYRPDILDTFVSLKIAEFTNQWYSTEKSKTASISLDWSEFYEYSVTWKTLWAKTLKEAKCVLGDDGVVLVTYDELCADKHNVTQAMFRFLQLWEMDYKIEHYSVKQNPPDLEKKLKNFEEVSKRLLENPEILRLNLA